MDLPIFTASVRIECPKSMPQKVESSGYVEWLRPLRGGQAVHTDAV